MFLPAFAIARIVSAVSRDQRRAAAVPAVAALAVARDASFGVELLAVLDAQRPIGRGRRGPAEAAGTSASRSAAERGRAGRQRLQLARRREHPTPSPRVAPANRAARVHDDVLLALALERRDGRVHAAVGLEFPERLAVAVSSAVTRPSLRPTNTRPPAVMIEPL